MTEEDAAYLAAYRNAVAAPVIPAPPVPPPPPRTVADELRDEAITLRDALDAARARGADKEEIRLLQMAYDTRWLEYLDAVNNPKRAQKSAAAKVPPVPLLAPMPSMLCAADIQVQVIEWLWKYWLALGKLHIIAGGKSDGKSTLMLSLGTVVTRGGTWPDGTLCKTPGYLVIWSGEDGVADTIVPRLKLMGADMRRVFILEGAKKPDGTYMPFDPTSDIARLDTALATLKHGPIFLVIDPIVSVVAAGKAGAMHQNNEVRAALAPLVKLAGDHNAVAIGVTHFTKGTKGANPLERVTGSLAFAALARVVLTTVKKPDDSERVLMRAGSNIGPSSGGFTYEMVIEPLEGHTNKDGEPVEYSRVVWGEAREGSARDVIAEVEGDDAADDGALDKSGECLEAMRKILSGEDGLCAEQPSAQVKFQLGLAGYSEKVIRTAKKRLKVTHRRDKASPPVSWWKLPPNSLTVGPPMIPLPPKD
jgi:putative DNA primase/helicase